MTAIAFSEDGAPPAGKHREARRLAKAAFWTVVAETGFILAASVFVEGAAENLAQVATIVATITIGLLGIVGTYMGVTNVPSQFK